ncbi:MAG: hypothetical protein AB3N64_09600 [Puniceicoccaceae bacterium]
MLNVSQGKEIVLRVKNDMGVLGEIARLVSERGVSIEAVSGTAEADMCTLRLVTDDNLRTCDLLQEHAYSPVEESVVLLEVPHKPGMLRNLTLRLGEEAIDIRSLYASASTRDAYCLMVLRTTNDARALVALSEFVTEYA